MGSLRVFFALIGACAGLSLATSSAVAGRGGIDVEHFRPNVDGRGLFVTESATTPGQWDIGFGAYLHYSHDPLVFASQSRDKRSELATHRLTATGLFSLGLTDWLEVGALLPFVLSNDTRTSLSGESTQVTGLGSFWFDLKLRILQQEKHGLGLAFIAGLGSPTGNHNAFLSQNGVTLAPMLALERAFGPVRLLANLGYTARQPATKGSLTIDDELFWRFGLGWRAGEKVELVGEMFGQTGASSPFGADDRLNPYEGALGVKLRFGNFEVPIGMGVGLSRGYGAPRARFFAGLTYVPRDVDTDGDGLVDRKDKCPLVPGPKENIGCPWPDTDGDGLIDREDKCPTVPGPKENIGCPWPDTDGDGLIDREDKCPTVPGPKENVGCPWPDTDGDGLIDREDTCPTVPGPKENRGCPWPDTDKDGTLDKDDRCPLEPGPKENQGCPIKVVAPPPPPPKPKDTDGDGIIDPEDECPTQPGPRSNKGCPVKGVQKKRGELRILTPVFFKFDRHEILEKSFGILNEVADTLKRYPGVKLVEVQGHTDDVGNAKYNKKLSGRRADEVRRYLIKKGIAAERLQSKGYGKDKPLVPFNKKKMSKAVLKEARSQNRRVQFIILKEIVEEPAQ